MSAAKKKSCNEKTDNGAYAHAGLPEMPKKDFGEKISLLCGTSGNFQKVIFAVIWVTAMHRPIQTPPRCTGFKSTGLQIANCIKRQVHDVFLFPVRKR